MKRILIKFLTNCIFKFLYYSDCYDHKNDRIKNGDILCYEDSDLFEYDDSNGNINKLNRYYRKNGFWNYIKSKHKMVYNIENNEWTKMNSQGYNGGEYYKNGDFRKATEKEIKMYRTHEIKLKDFEPYKLVEQPTYNDCIRAVKVMNKYPF